MRNSMFNLLKCGYHVTREERQLSKEIRNVIVCLQSTLLVVTTLSFGYCNRLMCFVNNIDYYYM